MPRVFSLPDHLSTGYDLYLMLKAFQGTGHCYSTVASSSPQPRRLIRICLDNRPHIQQTWDNRRPPAHILRPHKHRDINLFPTDRAFSGSGQGSTHSPRFYVGLKPYPANGLFTQSLSSLSIRTSCPPASLSTFAGLAMKTFPLPASHTMSPFCRTYSPISSSGRH